MINGTNGLSIYSIGGMPFMPIKTEKLVRMMSLQPIHVHTFSYCDISTLGSRIQRICMFRVSRTNDARRIKARLPILFNPLPVLEKLNIFDDYAIQNVSVSLDLIKLLTHTPFHN